jgi:aconitate hydratase
MLFDPEFIAKIYRKLASGVEYTKNNWNRPMTLTEKILYGHLANPFPEEPYPRGEAYVNFAPDRVAMQDATAQMALLQFMTAGKETTAVPSTVHCDHLILARDGAGKDLPESMQANKEVFDFLQSVSARYGIGFWKPGAGIIHQVVFENYAFPGGMMIGTDSHTPNAGGLGMIAIGVGGADAVDVMSGMPLELKMPKILGVELTGNLNGWASPKDVILKLSGLLTVKGGTGFIIEYFGEGVSSLSCTGKGTICNMGAEVGATCSLFPYDEPMRRYLRATGREAVVQLADENQHLLVPDDEVVANPEAWYDEVIRIDLSTLEPYVNGPFSPDVATPVSQLASFMEKHDYPQKLEVGLIGSCTNSSYEDLTRAASVARQAQEKNLKVQTEFLITPGSEQIRYTAERDGLLDVFNEIGGVVMANACGPCIGQWSRHIDDPDRKNTIITSFNRNFAKRNDGHASTHAFVASPEVVTAMALAGTLSFNPLQDLLTNEDGKSVKLDEPAGTELPPEGFDVKDKGFIAPPTNLTEPIAVTVDPDSERLQLLEPFPVWDGKDLTGLKLLIKARGKCTTDHISMAGPWLRFRGHLDNISNNLLMGAVNDFNQETNKVKNQLTGEYDAVSSVARAYKAAGIGSIIVGDENYGEGSSREHAAMEPRHLNAKVVLVKSFARIHETNLKKQGMLALTFADPADYQKIFEDDVVAIEGLTQFAPGKALTVVLHHQDGTTESFPVSHSYNELQIKWFKAGSALNHMKEEQKKV